MINIKVILLSILLGYASSSLANKDESIPIKQLINEYAELNQLNFILSPEVKGKVSLFGSTVEKMSNNDLIEMFRKHGFILVEKNGVVHIFSQYEVQNLGKGFGPIWRG